MADETILSAPARHFSEGPFRRAGYWNAVSASAAHAFVLTVRRQRIILATVITLLPVLIPLAIVFLSKAKFADDGSKIFVRMLEDIHIDTLAPLLALFFATMLVAEDVETQTIPYVLTRPMPRSAWIAGRFLSYLAVTGVILGLSIGLTFAACTALPGLTFTGPHLILLAHYAGVAGMALLAYGAFTVFIGAVTRRPIVIGVLVLYGWQRLVSQVPGLVDFLTIQKYTDAIMPKLATQRGRLLTETLLQGVAIPEYTVSAPKALAILAAITVVFLGLSVVTVRYRQYASARAVGG